MEKRRAKVKKFSVITGVLILGVVLGIAWLILSTFSLGSPLQVQETPSPTPVDTPANEQQYTHASFFVPDTSDISLLPNFTQKKTSAALIEENNCTYAINGGFYDTSNRPLGLFRIGENVRTKQIQSSLLNGFLSDDGITVAVPTGRFVLQSGPLLIQRGNPLPLKIQNDEHARRMVAAKTGEGLVFLTVYKEDSVFEGPLLAELPKVIQKINTKENLGIVDAINLDGGSASAFKNAETTLSELTPVGSLFCIK